jgi:hypothetical protein
VDRCVVQAELRGRRLEERPDEVVGIREVGDPPDEVQVPGIAVVDAPDIVGTPRG